MKQIKSVIVLVCICAVVAVMLAVTNMITAPIIEENQNAAALQALYEVMPEGKDFKKVDLSGYTLPATVTEAYSETGGGYVIRLTTTGYGPGMVIMCGIYADGTVSGAVCLASSETLGYEKTYGKNFQGLDAEGADAVDTISGATLTSGAYRAAVKDAFNAAVILSGGSADLRTDEEILQDHLSEALPEAEGQFTKLFIVEDAKEIEAMSSIYTADNGMGYVCIMDGQFIGIDKNGKVKGELSSDLTKNIESAVSLIKATTAEELNLTSYEGLPSQLVSAKKTATGNYIIEIKAAGYGINGGNDYHPASGKYIDIRVSVTAYGKIIDCMTISQAESENIGDACAKESFYGQFDGKTEANYQEIDAISGATITTNGYKTAIGRVFTAVKIFEGGADN